MNYVPSFSFTILSSSFYVPESLGQVNLIALLDMTYPGVNQLFNSPVRPDGSEKWVDYAELFWHVNCVRSLSLHAFSEKYRHFCEKQGCHFQQGKCESLYASAQDLIAVFQKCAIQGFGEEMAIGNLKEVITHVETLRAAMNEIASQLPGILSSWR